MIKAFFAVLKDLWDFVFGAEPRTETGAVVPVPALEPMGANVALASTERDAREPSIDIDVTGLRPAYVSVDEARCSIAPETGFDTTIATFAYGDRVGVRRLQEGYAEVVYADRTGWISVDELSDDERAIFPHLQAGVLYTSEHQETRKLRRCIADQCSGGELALPLQSLELVLYELRRRRTRVHWPLVRPRTPGSLHSIMRGRGGVNISIEPRTSAILEVATGPAEGFFGIVDSVHPDQSMTVSTVGRELEGEFRRETFQRDEWKEWRPTFISLT